MKAIGSQEKINSVRCERIYNALQK